MNKQELIKKWESKEGVPSYEISAFPVNPSLNEIYVAGYGVARKEILEDLKQLDKPKKVIFSHEEEFVANWLDGLKGEISDKKLSSGAAFMVFVGQQLECLYYNEYTLITDDVEGWLLHPENKVRLLNAIDNGYEVEKGPLYHVLLPDKGATNTGYTFLNLAGAIDFTTCKEKVDMLTEQEIKSIDERYWPFAEKVDGE